MNRSLKIAFVANLLFAFAAGIYKQILPLHLRVLGADAIALGQFGSLNMLFSAIAYFPATWLCNRFDYKKLILTGWLMCIPVPLIYAFAPHWQWTLFGSFLLYFSLFSQVALQNYIIVSVAPNELAATFTTIFSAMSMGAIFSQPLGGWLADRISFTGIFVTAAVFFLLSTFLYSFIEPCKPLPEARYAPSISLKLPRRHWILLLGFCLLYAIPLWPMDFVVPFIYDNSGLDFILIGILGAVSSLSSSVINPLLGKLADRAGIFRASAINLAVLTLSYFLLILFPAQLPFLFLSALARNITSTSSLYTASLGRIAQPTERSNYLSLFGFFSFMFVTVGPSLSGFLYHYHSSYPFLVTGLLCGGISVGLFIFDQRSGIKINGASRAERQS